MPQLQRRRRRVGGARVRQPEVPQGFFTADIRAEAAGAERRRRTAFETAQADIQRAGVISQAGRLADRIGELATNIAFRDAQNTGNSQKLAYDVNELTTVKEMAELVAKGAYGAKEGQRDIAKFTSDFTDKMAKHKATFDQGVKGLPVIIRDDLNARIKLQSTKQNLRISLQQAGMVQDAGAANTRERIQFIKDQVFVGEITLESGQIQTNDQYTFGITNGFFVDSAATTRSKQADLNALIRLDASRKDAIRAEVGSNFGKLLNATGMPPADKATAIAQSPLDAQQQRDAQGIVDRFDAAEDTRDEQQEIADGIALSTAQQDGTITWPMIRDSSVPNKEARRKTMNVEAARAAKGVPIATNQRALAGLREQVISVGRGSKTVLEMQEELDLARFGREKKGGGREYVSGRRPNGTYAVTSKTPLIDDAEYAKARIDAARELDRDIADAEQIRYSEARRLFLGAEIAGLDPASADFAARLRAARARRGDTQKHLDIRFEFLAKYSDEMRNWIVDNEERIRTEGAGIFYKFAAERRPEYQAFIEEQIKLDKATGRVTVGDLPAVPQRDTIVTGQPAEAGAEPTVTTKKEWDKLPSGAIFIGPDGKRRRKP